jgi:1-acyl-sn-glycerol-3-phosphate acyltransferase
MILVRSIIFNLLFYISFLIVVVIGTLLLPLPRKVMISFMQVTARYGLWLLKVCCGTRMEVRGLEHVPQGAVLIAGKHQSLWETFAILPLLADPAMVLKRELTLIPGYGWMNIRAKMIAVERSAGMAALRKMVEDAKAANAEGRQIVIMPEGTRRAPDDPPDYKPGAAALYAALDLPCVPFGLNSGLFWPRRKFMRYPGTIILSFLPPIPPGLPRKQFQQQLEAAIEGSTRALVAEGREAC